MKIVVTGGTGFIGKPVVNQLLNQGHEIYVITRKPIAYQNKTSVRFVQGNLNDFNSMSSIFKEVKPQILVHLAWEGLPDYSLKVSRQNLDYGIEVFSLAAESGCSAIVSTGSCWEYESRKGQISEQSKLNSSAFFPAVKNSLRLIGNAIAHKNNIKFYWLRLFYVYGPGQRNTSLIPYILNAIKNNETISINEPDNKNDFIFVDDIARAIASVIEHQPDKTIFNIGSGCLTSVKDIVNSIYGLFNRKINQHISEMFCATVNDQSDSFYADISKICSYTDWKPEFSIETGLRATYNHLI